MSRPKVVTFNVASLDGRIAASRDRLLLWGDERWQVLGEAGEAERWLRAMYAPQASLEGSGSLVREEDEPAALLAVEGDASHLYDDFLPESVTGRPGHRGWFTAVDGRGRVRNWIKDGAVFGEDWQGWHTLVLTCRGTPAAYLASLQRESIPYLVAGSERVDLAEALEKLGSRLRVERLLSTAGGRLNGALLRAGLVDEVNVVLLPGVIGGLDTPSLFDSPALGPNEHPVRLELVSAQVGRGGQVWLRYRPAP